MFLFNRNKWNTVYAIVVFFLLLQIGFYYYLSINF